VGDIRDAFLAIRHDASDVEGTIKDIREHLAELGPKVQHAVHWQPLDRVFAALAEIGAEYVKRGIPTAALADAVEAVHAVAADVVEPAPQPAPGPELSKGDDNEPGA
jgi:hypothetical protein